MYLLLFSFYFLNHTQMAPFPGGVVIKAAEGGDIVGAVGVSGASADEDEYCALMGVQEAGLEGVVTEPVQHALKNKRTEWLE
jgi:uncharacterized protein GlcG (DUF336 family)